MTWLKRWLHGETGILQVLRDTVTPPATSSDEDLASRLAYERRRDEADRQFDLLRTKIDIIIQSREGSETHA